jgi:hypothetical protein
MAHDKSPHITSVGKRIGKCMDNNCLEREREREREMRKERVGMGERINTFTNKTTWTDQKTERNTQVGR